MQYPLVILAAGAGRRMQAVKPLVKLLGMTLLERCILLFREAGIKKFYVVAGYEMGRVKEHVYEIGEKYGIDVAVIENKRWAAGNGTSVAAAEPYVDKFFVTMVDHVFDAEMVKDFVKNVDKDKCCLLVDRNVEDVVDAEEATKVKMENGKIIDIGKSLKEYDAIDTGLFFFTSDIFQALKMARENGDASLSGGVKKLAESGKMYSYEKKRGWWVDADTRENLKIAEEMILKSIPKKEEDGVISFYINRKISLRITRFLSNYSISPNIITLLSFIIAIFGSILFLFKNYIFILLAGIILQISSIIDGCDGEIARLKYLSTPFGAWLDTMLDRYADAIMAIFITYNGWMNYKNNLIWIFGLISILAFILASYSRKEYEIRYGKKWQNKKIDLLSKRDIRIFSVFIGSILARPFEFMAGIAIMHHVSIIISFLRRRK